MSVHQIVYQDRLLGMIVSASFNKPGIHFFTPNELSQQLAYMRHPAGKLIQPHIHNPVPREVHFTQEVLVIKSGKLRVDFYTDDREYLESYILTAGDVLLLVEGGHGFEVLEEVEMFEIKQGPYVGERDKVRFTPTAAAPKMPIPYLGVLLFFIGLVEIMPSAQGLKTYPLENDSLEERLTVLSR